MEVSDGERLLGEGRPIRLVDERVVFLRFNNRAMLKIEELFGSYNTMYEQLRGRLQGPFFTTVNKAVYCGLQHYPEWRGKWSELVDAIDENRVLDEYEEAIWAALFQNFRVPTQSQPGDETEPDLTSATDESTGSDSPPSSDESLASPVTPSGT
jgi:hypothetical protein